MIPTLTLSRFIHAEARRHPGATGELSDLLATISIATKYISSLVATSGLRGLTGYTGRTNVQGEATKMLDEEADKVLIELLGSSGHFGMMVSEEQETVISTSAGRESAKYVVAFDPLDGSSNIGLNLPVGTIFAIFRKRSSSGSAVPEDFLQPGRGVVAAGYAIYGPKTTFVYCSGNGVHEFTLDPSIGEYVLTSENITAPESGVIYSINEGNSADWDGTVSSYIGGLKSGEFGRKYSLRYSGSLVADFDRNLKTGGIFLYPADTRNPSGKLRLLYECIPLAFIAEHAGGSSTDGTKNILDVVPTGIHQRSALVIGSRTEVAEYLTRG